MDFERLSSRSAVCYVNDDKVIEHAGGGGKHDLLPVFLPECCVVDASDCRRVLPAYPKEELAKFFRTA